MGIRAGAGAMTLDNVRVPAENRLERRLRYRALWISALSAGVHWPSVRASPLLDYVGPYCNERIAFGQPINHRQSVAFAITDIAIELDAMRMLTYRAVCRAEQGKSFQREALARTLVKPAMKIGTDGVSCSAAVALQNCRWNAGIGICVPSASPSACTCKEDTS